MGLTSLFKVGHCIHHGAIIAPCAPPRMNPSVLRQWCSVPAEDDEEPSACADRGRLLPSEGRRAVSCLGQLIGIASNK
jgi:hypothetical protein